MDSAFMQKILRRFTSGKKLPATQLEELLQGGFIISTTDDTDYQLTVAGAQLLQKGSHQ